MVYHDVCILVTRVTRRVLLLEQEMLTFLEHTSSPPDPSDILYAQSVLLCVVYYKSLLVLFPLVIVLSALYSF